jgi:tetratricopeptide (TPR) repeat protein
MKLKKSIISALLGLALSSQIFAADFGHHTSSTLTTNAWNAVAANNSDDAIACIDKCLELYEGKAKEMQASLTAYAVGDDASQMWALNDVGTCLFIKGEVLMKKGDTEGAIKAYQKLVDEFKFAQTWDTKGWFWKPADAAKQKIVELSMDL